MRQYLVVGIWYQVYNGEDLLVKGFKVLKLR
jgi:hypothetical protein